jgi:hypothetical protein
MDDIICQEIGRVRHLPRRCERQLSCIIMYTNTPTHQPTHQHTTNTPGTNAEHERRARTQSTNAQSTNPEHEPRVRKCILHIDIYIYRALRSCLLLYPPPPHLLFLRSFVRLSPVQVRQTFLCPRLRGSRAGLEIQQPHSSTNSGSSYALAYYPADDSESRPNTG